MRVAAIAALRLLVLTGCRTGEIPSLRSDDVDRIAGVLRLRDGKTGPRMVSLTSPVLAVFDGIERIEGVPRVIRNRSGGRLTGLFSQWQRIRMEAGLHDVRVHDLRHSCATRPVFYEISSGYLHNWFLYPIGFMSFFEMLPTSLQPT